MSAGKRDRCARGEATDPTCECGHPRSAHAFEPGVSDACEAVDCPCGLYVSRDAQPTAEPRHHNMFSFNETPTDSDLPAFALECGVHDVCGGYFYILHDRDALVRLWRRARGK